MSETLMISVSGIRGHVGTDLTPELVARYAAAFGSWARTNGSTNRPADRPPARPTGRPSIVLGRAARTSGAAVARAATSALMSVGAAGVDGGIVPSATVQHACEYTRAAGA